MNITPIKDSFQLKINDDKLRLKRNIQKLLIGDATIGSLFKR